MLMVEAGVEYAIEYCEGKTKDTLDEDVLFGIINEVAGGKGKATISNYKDEATGTIDNFYMILCDYYDF